MSEIVTVTQADRELLEAEFARERMNLMTNEVPGGFINRRDQAALRAIAKARLDQSSRVQELREALEKAERIFLDYAGLHAAKKTDEGSVKAQRNLDYAAMIRAALNRSQP